MRTALIISLGIIILVLGGIWVYLLVFGAPDNIAGVRNNIFGEGNETATRPVKENTRNEGGTPTSRTVKTDALLVQLTTRQVAGAMISTSSINTFVRYTEKGTGHTYEIDLGTGAEIRLTNTTIGSVAEAIWSPTGDRVVLTIDKEGRREDVLLGTLRTKDGTTTLETESFGLFDNIAFSADGADIFYTDRNTQGGTTAFRKNLTSNDTASIFSVPFGESSVLFDLWEKRNHYIYTKPALGFRGYIYKSTASGLEKVDEGTTLSALRTGTSTVVVNKNTGQGPYSLLIDDERGTGHFLNIQTLTEKCSGTNNTLWCGYDATLNPNAFPTAWYQGTVSLRDSIFRTDIATGESTLVVNPETFARVEIDVTDSMYSSRNSLIFRNKRDDTLWLFNAPK